MLLRREELIRSQLILNTAEHLTPDLRQEGEGCQMGRIQLADRFLLREVVVYANTHLYVTPRTRRQPPSPPTPVPDMTVELPAHARRGWCNVRLHVFNVFSYTSLTS